MYQSISQQLVYILICLTLKFVAIGQEAQSNSYAPAQLGFTGVIYTPSAFINSWKTVDLGFTHFSKETSFTYRSGEISERAFLATMAFLPFAELSIKLTRPYSNIRPDFLTGTSSIRNWGIGDRSYSVRLQVLKETEKRPAVLVGVQDPIGSSDFFTTNYIVVSKTKDWKAFHISANAGFGWAKESSRDYLQGVFGGIQARWKQLSLMTEYDTQQINLGVGYQYNNRLFLNLAMIDAKYFSGNISFRFSLN